MADEDRRGDAQARLTWRVALVSAVSALLGSAIGVGGSLLAAITTASAVLNLDDT